METFDRINIKRISSDEQLNHDPPFNRISN